MGYILVSWGISWQNRLCNSCEYRGAVSTMRSFRALSYLANSYVRSQGTRQRPSVPTDSGSVSRNCNWLHRAGDGALRRRSIKLLFAGSAFRVSVSGLVLCLKGGRRAQPGHVVRDRGSPPWLHPRRCAALRFLLSTASTAGSSDGCDLSRAPRRSKAFARQQRPAGSAFTGVALSNTLDNRTRATCVLSVIICRARDHAAGATCCAIAHRNAAISRAIAAMTNGRFFPAAVSRR